MRYVIYLLYVGLLIGSIALLYYLYPRQETFCPFGTDCSGDDGLNRVAQEASSDNLEIYYKMASSTDYRPELRNNYLSYTNDCNSYASLS